jgi:hypothetical protein
MINFPSSPTLNQEYSYNGRIWKYNGTGWALKISDAALTSSAVTNALGYTPLSDLTSTDGSIAITTAGTVKDLSVTLSGSTNNLLVGVRNTTGATLTKGTAVYISGASGQRSLVTKALAATDATSAQTLGLITSDITNNSNGNVTAIGLISNIDTSAYTDGQQLYLSPTTAGALTATKPTAPNHMVYVAVVEYAHATQGKLFVKVQNGYELDEVHDVAITSVATNDFLVRNASNLWVNQSAATARTSMGLGTAATTASTAYATAAQGTKADSALQPAAIGVSVQGYSANTVIDSAYVHTDNNYTTAEKNKLAGIATGAEVNVNADWNSVSGDSQILNKPTLSTVATTGAYSDLSGKPTLGTAAATNSTAYATAAQGTLADSALQPAAIGVSVQAYNANNAVLNATQSFTQAQRGAVVALTDGATITPNFATGNNFSVTLAGNRTLASPTNLTAGQHGSITITQDATGSRTLAYGSSWKFSGGTAPSLTTTANAVDVLAYYVESGTRITAKLITDVK